MTDPKQSRISVVPCNLADANAYVALMHRHHQAVPTAKFCLAAVDEENKVRGVAIVFRPAARLLDDGYTAEVSRLATDGCPNACSALYGAAWRAARAMGYRRMTTYILDEEPGTSLKATGWRFGAHSAGGTWSRPSRPHVDLSPVQHHAKQRWEVGDSPPFPAPPRWPVADSPQLAMELEA